MALLTEYSLWFVLLCVLLGVVFAGALYYRNHTIEYDHRAKMTMMFLRACSTALIAFLLLAPMLKFNVKEVDKPLVIFAVDNSESMVLTADSSYCRSELQVKLNNLIHSFSDKYDVKTYLIGEKNVLLDSRETVSVPFTDKMTNLSSFLNDIENVYAHRNVGALVLVSDGIFNTGSNPQYLVQKLKFPIYTVALGDTIMPKDLRISDIVHNKQTYAGNYFPVEIKVVATNLAGQNAILTVFEKDQECFSKKINIRGNQHFETVKLTLQAKQKGVQHYRVELTALENEITHQNNVRQFYIDVVDAREKIAIVYYAPHPDVGAMVQALEKSDKYDVETFLASDFKQNIHDYDLLILHQLPAKKQVATALLSKIQTEGISCLYIIGKQTDLKALSNMNCGLTIVPQVSGDKILMNEAMPLYNENFLTFNFSENARQMLKSYTPLTTFFGEYRTAIGANVFMYQQISGVASNYPLISFYQNNEGRTGVIAGTDIWRWRMQNYLKTRNFEAFDKIINKIAMYLSVKGDKSFFRVHTQEVYNENTPVEFAAELYNESYELINEPDVRFLLKDAEGKEYVSQFSKQNNAYALNLGRLPVGGYSWEATAVVGAQHYKKSGTFAVQPVILESMNLVANHDVLRNMAVHSGGTMYAQNEFDKMEKALKDSDTIKPIVTYHKKYALILNSWLYWLLIILLLGVEWFMRKWVGDY